MYRSPLLQLFMDFAGIPKDQHDAYHAQFDRESNGGSRKVTIEHSGRVHEAVGCEPSGNRIWPISEYLVRRKHKRSVAERIERLNPYGKPEGESVRGVHPKFSPRHVILWGDFVPLREYEKKWGVKPARVAFKRGRHKFVTRRDFVAGPE